MNILKAVYKNRNKKMKITTDMRLETWKNKSIENIISVIS